MAIPEYADAGDYATWSGTTPPANIDSLLRSASLRVQEAIAAAVYDVDTDGVATDDDVIDALRDATCAQVEAWLAAGLTNPSSGAISAAGVVSSEARSLNGASKSTSYDTSLSASVTAFQAREAAARSLADDAARILTAAGLVPSVVSYG